MKKSISIFLVALVAIVSVNCSKDKDAAPSKIEVTDVKSLNNALVIEGAEKKSGDIPFPGGSAEKDLQVQTTSVIVTPNSEFDLVVAPEDEAGFIFIKLDGTDSYFQIPITDEMRAGRTKLSAPIKSTIKLNAQPMKESFDAPATVQTFTMPVQSNQTVDFSKLTNWSLPKRVIFKAVATGTGSITVTLTWDKDDSDIDLWLIEPDGNQIDYTNETSETGGYLDYDNTSGFGPENIFYDDEAEPLSGKYEVKVNYYSGSYIAGEVNYTVVVQNGSSVNTYRGTLTQDDETDLVATFTK